METIILYNFIMFFCYLLAYSAEKGRPLRKLKVASIIMMLSLLVGLRSVNVGIDTYSYVSVINTIYDTHPSFEATFIEFIRLLCYINNSYTFVFLVISFLTNGLIIHRYWQLRNIVSFRYCILCYYLMFYFNTMSGIRQCLAVAIVFFFSKYVIEQWKLQWFLLGLLMAICVHRTAVIGVLLLVPRVLSDLDIKRMKASHLWLILIAPLVCIIAMFLFATRYSGYTINKFDIGFMALARLLIWIPMTYQISICKRFYMDENKKNVLKLCIFSEVVVVMAIFSSYIVEHVWRIGWYFWLYSPVIFSFFLKKSNVKSVYTFLIKTGILIVLAISYLGIMQGTGNKFIPYEFFWKA